MKFYKDNFWHLLILGLLVGLGYFLCLACAAILYFENDNWSVVWLRMLTFLEPTSLPFLILLPLMGWGSTRWVLGAASFLMTYIRCVVLALTLGLIMSLIYFYPQIYTESQWPWSDGSLLMLLLEYSGKGLLYSLPGLLFACVFPSLYLHCFRPRFILN